MSIRTELRDTLKTGLPSWSVIAEARTPDAITRPTAITWLAKLTRLDYQGGTFLQGAADLWLLVPSDTTAETLEDKLDAQLEAVLELLESEPSLTWTDATRGSLDGAHHGWHLILTIAHQLTT